MELVSWDFVVFETLACVITVSASQRCGKRGSRQPGVSLPTLHPLAEALRLFVGFRREAEELVPSLE